jgi:putative aldouronate transport system permease protein
MTMTTRYSKAPRDASRLIFNIVAYSFTTALALVCLTPFLLLISASFSDEQTILRNGFKLIPERVSLEAYNMLLRNPRDILNAYGVSFTVTALGAAVGLFVTAMTAYVLCRKDVRHRNKIALYFYFVTLFNGGLVSTYIVMIRYYRLKNSLLALILPLMINVFYLIVMRSFLSSIPDSLAESAKMDGANDLMIFIRIILPLSKPALATVGLFLALDYWNDWYNAMLYITKPEMYPLQYLLYNMLATQEALARLVSQSHVSIQNQAKETIKMAMACIATGPILLLYPFVQKYFIRGITVGAVKG